MPRCSSFLGIPSLVAATRLPAVADYEAELLTRFGDRTFLRSMARLFEADAAKSLSRIRQAIARGDAEELRSAAHALKGSAGNFLADAAVEAAQQLEIMGREHNLLGADESLIRLEAEIAALTQRLAALGRKKR